jgi:hypothetical protein
MSLRFRRNRTLILFLLLIIVIIYLTNNHSQNSIDNEDDLKDVKSQSVLSTVREQVVEIDDKKLRKIDWHDYEYITRDNARIGSLVDYYLFIFIVLIVN